MDPNAESPAIAPLVTYEDLASRLDWHVVAPELTDDDVLRACEEARRLGVATLVVRPSDLEIATRILNSSSVRVGAVCGYPHGSTSTAVKLYEVRDVVRRGAKQVECVLNIGRTISRQFQYVETELLQAVEFCQRDGATLNVVLELPYLPDDLRHITLRIAKRIGAEFVTTATDHAPRPTTLADVALLVAHQGFRIRVKAAGGINTLAEAQAFLQAGCERLGSTQAPAILAEWQAELERRKQEETSAAVS